MNSGEEHAASERDPFLLISSLKSLRPELGRLAIFEIAFYLAYSYGMTFPQDYPSPFWFPNSVLLCALLLMPRRVWWIYLLAPIPIRLVVFVPPGAPPWLLPACYLTDTLSTLLAAWRLAPVRDSRNLFGSLPAFIQYVAAAVILAPCASAFAGASIVSREAGYWTTWQIWFLGSALAHLTLTPALYCLIREGRKVFQEREWHQVEVFLLLAGAISSCYFAFCPMPIETGSSPVLLYLPLPFVIWAATRFGPPMTAVALSVICVLAVTGTLWCNSGPFSAYSGASCILQIQLFLFVLSSSLFSVSVLFKDRDLAQRRLQQLGLQLVSVQEAERSRIGQELHDDLAQRIVALSWGVAALERHAEANESLSADCTRLRGQATEICNDLVRISHELRPVALERRGLVAALQALCDESMPVDHRRVRFEHSGDAENLSPSVELALYRVAQEALRNALRHSGSDQVLIQLTETDSTLTLAVADQGRGFEHGATELIGLGLSGMADRMQNVGGTLQIDSSPSGGTMVRASVPLASDRRADADAQAAAG
jgi:signal transduction histidine kinase